MVIFYTNLIIVERELHPPSSIALARSFINFHRAPGAINLKCVRSGEHGGLLRCPAPAGCQCVTRDMPTSLTAEIRFIQFQCRLHSYSLSLKDSFTKKLYFSM